jgi:acetoin utilization protein AcuB
VERSAPQTHQEVKAMLVKSVMTSPVVTVDPQTTIRRAWDLLQQWHCRHLPVVAHDTLVGIVSDRDLQAALVDVPPDQEGPTVHAIMHRSIRTVAPETSLEEASRKLAELKIGALPVLDGRRLVGIVTETDLLRLIGRSDQQ